MSKPSNSSGTDPEGAVAPRHLSSAGRVLAIVGAWMQLGPFIGVAGTVIGMIHAFDVLAAADSVGDPAGMSAAIGEVLWSSAIGLVISLAGIVMIFISLFVFRYRAPWMFWFLMWYGGITTLMFSPVGLILLIYGLMKRDEFLPPPPRARAGVNPD